MHTIIPNETLYGLQAFIYLFLRGASWLGVIALSLLGTLAVSRGADKLLDWNDERWERQHGN